MCYSARIVADYRKYVRMFDAGLSLNDFVDLFWNRNNVSVSSTGRLSKMSG